MNLIENQSSMNTAHNPQKMPLNQTLPGRWRISTGHPSQRSSDCSPRFQSQERQQDRPSLLLGHQGLCQHFLEENDDLDHNDDDQVDGMAVGLLILGLITRIVRLDTPKHVV